VISSDVAGVAKNVTFGAAGVAVYGGWTANEVAAVGGFIVAVIGLCVQVYYKRKGDRRDAEFHTERMRELREEREE
jgi:hypothetical protein